MKLKTINVKAIRIDGGTQSRVEINDETVNEYADAIKAKAVFPPMVVFYDGADHWLADGFHRWHALNKAGKASAEIDLRIGTRREAVLFSFGVNGTHGMRRTNADKRKAVKSMLEDSEWAAWSDNKIADTCGVSHPFVAEIRRSILKPLQDRPAIRTVERAGKTYQQDTTNIGKPKRPAKPKTKPTPVVDKATVATLDGAQAEAPAPADDGPNAAELAANEMAVKADMEAMQKILDSDDKLAAAYAEIKRLNAELAAVKQARDGYMNQCNEQIRRIKAMQRKLDKAAA